MSESGSKARDARPSVDRQPILSQLERIPKSSAFAQSEQLRSLLRFAVERKLDGLEDTIKEYNLGVEVFGRDRAYDPRVDPIVRVQASRLRSKLAEYYLGDGRDDPIRIELPRGSYVPAFAPHSERSADSSSRQGGPSRLLWAAAAIALVALVTYAFWGRGRNQAPVERAPSGLGTIAVLPITDMSHDGNQDYFCDGLTEELTNLLTGLPGLKVVPRTTAFQFKGRALDLQAIGKSLGADLLLQGSVRRVGQKLRVSEQLIRARDGEQLWWSNFDGDATDVLSVQERIATAIVKALEALIGTRGKLEGNPPKMTARDGGAYDLYLQAHYAVKLGTEEGLARSVELYEQASLRDPSFALSHAGLSEAYVRMALPGLAGGEKARARAKEAALKALAIEGNLVEPLVAMAAYQIVFEWNWRKAESQLQAVFQKRPDNSLARQCQALLLATWGRLDEALLELGRARELDALSLGARTLQAQCLYLKRDFDGAIREAEQIVALAPDHYLSYVIAGRACLQKGRFPEAVQAFERVSLMTGRSAAAVAGLAQAYGYWQKPEKASALLAELDNLAEFQPVSPLLMARVQLALGNREKALQWMERGLADRSLAVFWLKTDPELDPLRSEQRFRAILQKAHLSD